MPVKLRLKLSRIDDKYNVEVIAYANSGFIASEAQLLVPNYIVIEKLKLDEICKPITITKYLADGSKTTLHCYKNSIYVEVITEDGSSRKVLATVLSSSSRYVLISDYLLSELGICIIDAREGIWCFRDELGKKFRTSIL